MVVFFNYFEVITWAFFTSKYFTDCFLSLIRRISSRPLMFLCVYLLIYFRLFIKYLFYSPKKKMFLYLCYFSFYL